MYTLPPVVVAFPLILARHAINLLPFTLFAVVAVLPVQAACVVLAFDVGHYTFMETRSLVHTPANTGNVD